MKPAQTPSMVICPNCVHQFRAIPEDVQEELKDLREEAEHFNDTVRAFKAGMECHAEIAHLTSELEAARKASIPFSDIKAEIAHIKINGQRLRELCGDHYEGRCRELCAMYLLDFMVAHGLKLELNEMDEILKERSAAISAASDAAKGEK